ncbi:MAG: hypothetical protein K0S65_5735, partial [Labilithrix sp.]|nr:hypothetical protein [Labilithrix sp.]
MRSPPSRRRSPTLALRTKLVLGVIVLGVVPSAPRHAHASAEELPLKLRWEAAETCPEASFVVRRVAELVEGRPRPMTEVLATARIHRARSGRFELALAVHTTNGDDERSIDAPSCSPLAEASAVVIALAMAPAEPPRDTTPPRPSTETTETTRPPETERPAAPTLTPPSRPSESPPSGIGLGIGLGPTLGAGILPELGSGLALSAALRHRGLRLGVLGTVWLRQRSTFTGEAGATFDRIDVGAFGCWLFPIRVVAAGPCANIEATSVRVEGFGIRSPHGSWTHWPTVVLGPRAEARVTRHLDLYVRADVVLPIGAH